MKKHTSLSNLVVKKNISTSRKDIADWNNARTLAARAENPKFHLLQQLYDNIVLDALLSSQINNRHERTIAAPFQLLNPDGTVNDKLTEQLTQIPVIQDLFKAILDSELFGYSLVELNANKTSTDLFVLPRQNIDPTNGRFYPDYYCNDFINYRQANEYGKWILEFNSNHIGLLNKAVPHILFKKFAQSCWSELCEIYGIPPRFIKTNTTDEAMLQRAQQMLQDMGNAAAFVIDTNEEFQFAQGTSTNGDVYANLIRLCNQEISLLISGAIIGQDTENGNYSKEQSSIEILDRLIDSDKRMVETYMNSTVLPALQKIGWLPQTSCLFRFSAVEDTDKTWQLVKEILPYKDIDNQWLSDKFGIPVKDKVVEAQSTLSAADSFFV